MILFMGKIIKRIWGKFLSFLKWLWMQLKDWRTLIIFIVVLLVMYFPTYGFLLFSLIFKNPWFAGAATVYAAFWAGPFTPFFPICIALTLGIKKIISKIAKKKNKGAARVESMPASEEEEKQTPEN